MSLRTNRRKFMAGAAALGTLAFHPYVATARQKKEEVKLRIGCIGVGNRGQTNAIVMVNEQVTTLCDVDENFLAPMLDRYRTAKTFVDWRECLEKSELDAVVISTPDHTHAPIALTAIQKGLHVYIEKPLAHNVREVRLIEKAAKDKGVVAWMGNQHHATPGYRRAIELLETNLVGTVKEVHAWTVKPTWAQGRPRPQDVVPIPTTLNWDLWLGPAALRPYHPYYHPEGWRGWWDFGGGALADMGPHLLDPVFWGLKLTAPTKVSAVVATEKDRSPECAPSWSKIKFEFAARGDAPGFPLYWYDGGQMPPKEIIGERQPPLNGVMVVGELGKIFIPDLGRRPIVISNNRLEPIVEPEVKLTLSRGHHQEWLDACKTRTPNHDNFAICCRLTEMCLVGNIAVRVPRELNWVSDKGSFTNDKEADRLLARAYRRGWELPKVG